MLLLLNKIYFAKLQHWLGRGDLCNARKKTFFSREMFPRWLNEEVASLPSRSYWGSSEVCAPHRPLVHLLLLAQSWSFLCINMKIKHRCKSLEQTYQQKSKRKKEENRRVLKNTQKYWILFLVLFILGFVVPNPIMVKVWDWSWLLNMWIVQFCHKLYILVFLHNF